MTGFALISDVHSNLEALEAGLARIDELGVEEVDCLGDIVGYGVDPGPPPDGCIRCRLCIRVCKEIVGPGALKMEKREGQNFVVPIEGLCIGCGTCANICPTKVIQVDDRDNVRTILIRDEVVGRHPLERCEGCGRLYATPKFLDHVHDRTAAHHADVKAPHHYCPTCAKLFSDRIKSMQDRSRK